MYRYRYITCDAYMSNDILGSMTVAQLAKLNRRLRDLLLLTSANKGKTPSAGRVAIFEDIYKNSPTTVQGITKRTKLAQSYVSKTIAQMKQKEVVRLTHSQDDKRQVIITFNNDLSDFVRTMSEQSIHDGLSQLLPNAPQADLKRIDALLTELSALLDHVGDSPSQPSR